MKIAILSGGTRGDVQPYVALGEFLAGRGHEVVLATHEPFRAMAEARGLEFVGLPGDPRQQIQTQEGRELVSSQRASLRFVRQLSELVEPWLEQLLEDVTPLCEKSDVVVYSPLAFLAWHVSQATGTPTVLAALQPYAPTREFPTVVLGDRNSGRSLNLASHYLADGLAWLSVGRTVNRLRTERLGLPPLGWRGSGPELRRQREPHLFGYSRHLVPKPADWGPHHHVTGYWFLDDLGEGLESGLEAFLDAGESPVYIGFGSMATADATTTAELVIEATRRAGVRVVMSTGWGGMAEGDSDERVFFVGETPHDVLFPRMQAVVHHGGAGTTGAVLRAGVPQVVVPFLADQAFWGSRVAAAGVGPTPIPSRMLTAGALEAALREVTGNSGHRQAAAALGVLVRKEDGLEEAATVLEDFGDRGLPRRA